MLQFPATREAMKKKKKTGGSAPASLASSSPPSSPPCSPSSASSSRRKGKREKKRRSADDEPLNVSLLAFKSGQVWEKDSANFSYRKIAENLSSIEDFELFLGFF